MVATAKESFITLLQSNNIDTNKEYLIIERVRQWKNTK